ncbi:MAG: hypothetical protein NTW44_05715 [Nitrospirae bacterium]|nr:hypothetical protein [Nitrospirota bacterium]
MKKISISIAIIILFWLSGKADATSPQPEEVKPGPATTVCNIYIVYTATEKGIPLEAESSSFTFDASVPKKDVLEKMMSHARNKLSEWNVSEFKIECKFPK